MPSTPRLPLRLVALSTLVALAAAVGTYALLSDDGDDDPADDPGSVVLTPAGDLDDATYTTFDGEVVQLASLVGKPLVVNFFSSTCVPCITEMPAFEAVHQQVGDQVQFLGLAMADQPEGAQALVRRTGVTYPTAQDKDGSAIAALGGTVLPTTVVIDADGEIVATRNGELDADELRELLADELDVRA